MFDPLVTLNISPCFNWSANFKSLKATSNTVSEALDKTFDDTILPSVDIETVGDVLEPINKKSSIVLSLSDCEQINKSLSPMSYIAA